MFRAGEATLCTRHLVIFLHMTFVIITRSAKHPWSQSVQRLWCSVLESTARTIKDEPQCFMQCFELARYWRWIKTSRAGTQDVKTHAPQSRRDACKGTYKFHPAWERNRSKTNCLPNTHSHFTHAGAAYLGPPISLLPSHATGTLAHMHLRREVTIKRYRRVSWLNSGIIYLSLCLRKYQFFDFFTSRLAWWWKSWCLLKNTYM